MKVPTFRLMEALGETQELRAFTQEYQEEFLSEPAHAYLQRLLEEKQLTTAQMCERAGLANYGYKLLSGVRKPSRDAALRIAVGLEMSLEQAQHYLRLLELARLDPRSRRDAAVIFALGKGMNLARTQVLLSELGEEEL